eukprot:GILK01014513.1.p1 GENE.GILK01014513.1~~GILK01014513.1.p1  ORF type:complete len:597 (+),score=35.88 GILK01014513.1:239-2029(+)
MKSDTPSQQDYNSLRHGAKLLKLGRKGRPHHRYFWLSTDLNTLRWRSPRKPLDETLVVLSHVSEFRVGLSTDIFRKHKANALVREGLAFSLIYYNSSLDVVCSNAEEFQLWARCLHSLIHPQPSPTETTPQAAAANHDDEMSVGGDLLDVPEPTAKPRSISVASTALSDTSDARLVYPSETCQQPSAGVMAESATGSTDDSIGESVPSSAVAVGAGERTFFECETESAKKNSSSVSRITLWFASVWRAIVATFLCIFNIRAWISPRKSSVTVECPPIEATPCSSDESPVASVPRSSCSTPSCSTPLVASEDIQDMPIMLCADAPAVTDAPVDTEAPAAVEECSQGNQGNATCKHPDMNSMELCVPSAVQAQGDMLWQLAGGYVEESQSWLNLSCKPDIEIRTSKTATGDTLLYTMADLPYTVERLYDYWTSNWRHEATNSCAFCRIVELQWRGPSGEAAVFHSRYKFPFPMTDREFVCQRFRKLSSDDKSNCFYEEVYCSVMHPKAPASTSVIRAESKVNYTRITRHPSDSNRACLARIVHTDFKNDIVNTCIPKRAEKVLVEMVDQVHQYMKKFSDWEHDPQCHRSQVHQPSSNQ